MLPNEGCTRRRPSRFVRSGKTEFRATAVRGSRTGKKTGGLTRFIRPPIAPTAVKINQRVQLCTPAKLWRKFCSSKGAPKVTRWPVDAARPGGQEKSVAMSWFYMAMQREPVVMWSCFIGALGTHPRAFPSSQRRCPYAVQSARASPDRVARALVPGRARPPADRPAISARTHRVSRREPASRRPALATVDSLRASRASLVSSSCFPRLTRNLRFPPRQASRCPWWSPPSASPSGARKPCLLPTRTRSPRRSEEATDARARWRRDGRGVDSSRVV